MLLIKDVLLSQNVSIELINSVEEAINAMSINGQGVIVVVSNNLPVGIVTERDVLHLINDGIDYSASVESILKYNHLITVNSRRTVEYSLHVLIDNNIRRLVVVDDFSNFLGVVTQDILIKHLEDDTFQTNLIISNFIQNTRSLICVDQQSSLNNAFNIMNDKNIGSIVVNDESENPIGILTEKDAIGFANTKGDLEDCVTTIMSSPIVCVHENEKVKDVVDLMDEKHIRRVLVTAHEDETPLGILSIRDIAKNLKGNYGQLLESKLKNVKSTLNYIGESILEIVEDNGEKIIQWMNDRAILNFGNLIGNQLESVINEEIWEDVYQKVKLSGQCEKYKLHIKDLYFEMMCSYHFVKNKEALLIILRDISKFEYAVIDANRKSADLKKELDILQGVIDQQNNIVVVTDGENIVSANKRFYNFFQVDDLENFKQTHNCLSDTFISHKNFFNLTEHKKNWLEEISKLLQKDRVVSIVELNTVEPKAFTVQLNKLNSDESNYVVTLTDITDIKLESQMHYFHATHDSLTKVYNRAYYFDTIGEELEKAKRYTSVFSVILFDVDHFKMFNDTYGHLKGDEVLIKIAQVINSNVRKSDIFARWGGEEFIVLLPETKLEKAELLAENLRKIISNIKLPGINQVTSSFGVTEYKENDDRNSLLARVDESLYEAKADGRNCVKSK